MILEDIFKEKAMQLSKQAKQKALIRREKEKKAQELIRLCSQLDKSFHKIETIMARR